MCKMVMVGKILQELQDRILRSYPTGTKIRIVGIVAEITEPEKPMREVTFDAATKHSQGLYRKAPVRFSRAEGSPAPTPFAERH